MIERMIILELSNGKNSRKYNKSKNNLHKKSATSTMDESYNDIKERKPISFDENNEYSFNSSVNTPTDFAKMGMAVGTAFDVGDIIIVGHCNENSAMSLTESFISGLISTGAKVFYLGACTSQHIMFLTSEYNADAGCFISATYVAKIQIKDKGGLPLKKSVEQRIENAYNHRSFRSLDYNKYKKPFIFSDTKALYEMSLDKMLPKKFRGILANIRTPSKEIAVIADDLFYQRNDIDGERIVFHISSDGTSCSAYSDKTGYVIYERLIMLAMKCLYEQGREVSLPYTFPSIAENIAKEYGVQVFRYYNSSDNNSDELARLIAQRTDNLFVRDGLALVCVICSYLSKTGQSFSKAMESIIEFTAIQRFVSYKGDINDIADSFPARKHVYSEGVIYSNNGSKAVIHPLKNNQGILIFAESFNSELASGICDEIQDTLKKYEDIGK